MDMLIGDANGKLHLFNNTGSNPPNFVLAEAEYKGLDVGYFAFPQLVDVNRDGLLDIIIGEQSGTINYCENTGTNSTPIFDTIIQYFGGIDIESNIISSRADDITFNINTSKILNNGIKNWGRICTGIFAIIDRARLFPNNNI